MAGHEGVRNHVLHEVRSALEEQSEKAQALPLGE